MDGDGTSKVLPTARHDPTTNTFHMLSHDGNLMGPSPCPRCASSALRLALYCGNSLLARPSPHRSRPYTLASAGTTCGQHYFASGSDLATWTSHGCAYGSSSLPRNELDRNFSLIISFLVRNYLVRTV